MEITEHEEHLNAILESITDGEQRANVIEHFETIRADYGSTIEEYKGLTSKVDKLQKDHDSLVVSNSKLFRERAVIPDDEKQEEQEVDENITLESLGI